MEEQMIQNRCSKLKTHFYISFYCKLVFLFCTFPELTPKQESLKSTQADLTFKKIQNALQALTLDNLVFKFLALYFSVIPYFGITLQHNSRRFSQYSSWKTRLTWELFAWREGEFVDRQQSLLSAPSITVHLMRSFFSKWGEGKTLTHHDATHPATSRKSGFTSVTWSLVLRHSPEVWFYVSQSPWNVECHHKTFT